LFIGIFLISFISSFDDAQLPQICGGDSELLIGCLGDEELVFLAGEAPEQPPWSKPGVGPDYLKVPKEEIPEKEKVPLKVGTWIMILLFLLIIVSIFVSRRRKKKRKILLLVAEEEEKEKDKSQPTHLSLL